jgi:hypothetical protein
VRGIRSAFTFRLLLNGSRCAPWSRAFVWVMVSMLVMLACLPSAPSVLPTPGGAEANDTQPSLPLRAAFYYPWFPEAWTQQGRHPYTSFTVSAGAYDSGKSEIIQQHLDAMEYGRIRELPPGGVG